MSEELVPVFIMGKRYDVPPSLTIMKAMEYAGYQLIRGVGCRGGFCGACGTVYRLRDDDTLYFCLACQTVVQPHMYLVQIPFFPAQRAEYDLSKLAPSPEQLFSLYPELLRCLGCGTCTKACPQDLDVKGYMAAAMRGDIAARGRPILRLHHVRVVRRPLSGGRGPVQHRRSVPQALWPLPGAPFAAPGGSVSRDRG